MGQENFLNLNVKNNMNNNFILMGLPNSGKSTFIGALWYFIDNNQCDNSLKINSSPLEREYLNSLRNSWVDCNIIRRTHVGSKELISLNVIDNRTAKESNFIFPDVSGEMYKEQFQSRKLDEDYYEMVQSVDGILLFINPNDVNSSVIINDVISIEDQKPNEATIPWSIETCHTQVVLTDLLQIVKFSSSRIIKVAVVISAWDSIIPLEFTPLEWLKKELPLLFQFLHTNKDSFIYSTFGISAQGAEYSDNNNDLLDKDDPIDRIIVQSDSEKTKDISLPIKWLIDNE